MSQNTTLTEDIDNIPACKPVFIVLGWALLAGVLILARVAVVHQFKFHQEVVVALSVLGTLWGFAAWNVTQIYLTEPKEGTKLKPTELAQKFVTSFKEVWTNRAKYSLKMLLIITGIAYLVVEYVL